MDDGTASAVVSRDDLGLPVDYRAPATPREIAVADAFRAALNLDRVGMDDDFFDLGGDSVAATEIVLALEPLCGSELQPGLLVELATPARLCDWIGNVEPREEAPPVLVPVRTKGDRPPLFIIPGAMGLTFLRPPFMAGFDQAQPLYSFQLRGLDGRGEAPRSVEEAARENVAAIDAVYPAGPVQLTSFCVGMQVAVEMALLLAAKGRPPVRLVMIDPRIDKLSLAVGEARARQRAGGAWGSAVAERLVALRETGVPGRLLGPDGHLSAAMRAAIVEKARERYTRVYKRDIQKPQDAAHRVAGAKGVEAIAHWQAALRDHCPAPFDAPVDVIFSPDRARLFETDEALRKLLPQARVSVVGEGSHHDMFNLNGTITASALQKLLLPA
jgi:thioesterase domain-containing protein/acyl carrier protein